MSVRAQAHFATQAAAIGSGLPPLLNGEALTYESDPPVRIPIHALDDPRIRLQLDPIRQWHGAHIEEVGLYLGRWTIDNNPAMARDYNSIRLDNLCRVSRNIFRFLVPKKLSAGHLEDMQIEAVMPEDLHPSIVHHFGRLEKYRPTKVVQGSETYILTSAHLHAGRSLGRVGVVSYLSVQINEMEGREPVLNLPAAHATKRLSTNEMLAHSVLWQSGALRHTADEASLRIPLQGRGAGVGCQE